ncbi:hypothetical protein M2169_004758 [Streptomyces sp. MJP52]|nr:hypothetical protein [Streptomyces sp. MJP52]
MGNFPQASGPTGVTAGGAHRARVAARAEGRGR